MLPGDLAAESFAAYPPEAKMLAGGSLSLLRQLPLAFLPLILRELIVYDWKFPAERRSIDTQFAWLSGLTPEQLVKAMGAFAGLHLTDALRKMDWVNSPSVFSAHLWATHQIDAFRAAAVDYVARAGAGSGAEPLPTHRLGIAVIGQGVERNTYRLFRKLRREGVYFTQLRHANGLAILADAVAKRAAAHPAPYGHWYIDGGASPNLPDRVTSVSYTALTPLRAEVQRRMQSLYEGRAFDPEAFRTVMAQTKLEDVGITWGKDPVLNRFQLGLLTEGSGTQVFATTFVQWAAREALWRAQPLTLLARFAPRQRERPMNELLGEAQHRPASDAQGSLIDADMGAYYSWLNQQRLASADQARFLAWFEDHEELVAIGPGFERNKTSDAPVELRDLVAEVT